MNASEPVYRLVLFEPPGDPEAARDLLRDRAGMHPTDAMQWIARAPGVLPRPLDEATVRALLDGLYELGIPAEAWRADAIPNLSPPRPVHKAACRPEGFRVHGLRGEPTHWVPWDRVELVAAGKIDQPDDVREVVPPGSVRAIATALNALLHRPQAVARRRRAMRVTREPVGEVIVVRRDPRLAFRIAEDQMSYAYLGDRLRPSASENFPLFLADLCGLAADAYVTPSTRSFLEGGPAERYTFATSQALLDYATHRLLWSWYRRDRDADRRTEA